MCNPESKSCTEIIYLGFADHESWIRNRHGSEDLTVLVVIFGYIGSISLVVFFKLQNCKSICSLAVRV